MYLSHLQGGSKQGELGIAGTHRPSPLSTTQNRPAMQDPVVTPNMLITCGYHIGTKVTF